MIQCWIFLAVTGIRSVVFFVYQSRLDKKGYSPVIHTEGGGRLWTFRVLYLVTWVGVVFALAHERIGSATFVSGIALLLMGFTSRWCGLRALGSFYSPMTTVQGDHRMVRKGIYGLIRHPLLTGLILELLGMAVIAHRAWIWLTWFVVLALLSHWQAREDHIHREYLGADARRYQEEVPGMNIFIGLWRRLRSGDR